MLRRALQCSSLLVCVALAAHGQAMKEPVTEGQTPYTFMGLSPRQSLEESAGIIAAMGEGQLKFSAAYCPKSGPGFKTCSFQHYFPLTSFTVNFVDGKSARIIYTFYHRDYEVMVQAIVKKYGPAKSDTADVVQNRMGASFQGSNHQWSNAATQIDSSEYFSTMDQSAIVVSDPNLAKEFDKRVLDNGPKI